MSSTDAHAVVWNLLRRAETHDSHTTLPMIPGTDRGPIRLWCCPIRVCRNTAYTYVPTDPAPLCTGGAKWSFATTKRFDAEEGV
jgi:hypothetical protein